MHLCALAVAFTVAGRVVANPYITQNGPTSRAGAVSIQLLPGVERDAPRNDGPNSWKSRQDEREDKAGLVKRRARMATIDRRIHYPA